jgi:hypothetical protein
MVGGEQKLELNLLWDVGREGSRLGGEFTHRMVMVVEKGGCYRFEAPGLCNRVDMSGRGHESL